MVDRLSIDDGMGTGGVVSHHAAESGAIRGRRIGAEEKSRRLQMQVKLFLHHSWLDESPAFLRVHVQHAIQVLGHVHDHSLADCLTGQTCASSSWKDGNIEIARYFHRREDIFVCSRENDTEGFYFVDAGVSTVEKAGNLIESNFSGDLLF